MLYFKKISCCEAAVDINPAVFIDVMEKHFTENNNRIRMT